MFDLSGETLLYWLARLPVIFFALTVHEFAHAWTAVKCGDPTPERQGRVTLNPMVHLDPIGTLMIIFGPVGWGRPVEVNPFNFRNRRRDELLVSAAGPLSNILQAVVYSFLFPIIVVLGVRFLPPDDTTLQFVISVCSLGIIINLALAVFNMIPLFPLDGEKVLVNSLPPQQARKVVGFRQTSTMILIGLLILGFVTSVHVLWWLVQTFMWPFLVFLAPQSGLVSKVLFGLLT